MENIVRKWFRIGECMGMHRCGKSVRDIAGELQLTKSTVGRWIKNYREGNLEYRKRVRRKKTSARSNRLLIRIAKAHRKVSASHLRDLWNENVSVQTVYRRLREVKLKKYRKALKPFLSQANIIQRERWCMRHSLWRELQWNRIVWTDESRFRLHVNDGRIRVTRERGQRFSKEFVGYTRQGGGGSVHVWCAIWFNGKSSMIILHETINGMRYRQTLEDFIANHQLPPNFILQDDNAPAHRATVVTEWKAEAGIRYLDWPSRSPDLNPIEHCWDRIGRRIFLGNPPENLQDLRARLLLEWENLEQNFINNLIDSMTRRVGAIIEAKGATTRY